VHDRVREEAIMFACAGEDTLGILHHASRAVTDVGILIIVGGPQYRVGSHRQFVLMARMLAASGFDVFRFDYRGMGDSSGRAITFESAQPDIQSAIAAFRDAVPSMRRVVVFGLCDAASAALMYCTDADVVVGLVLANPWARTPQRLAQTHVRHYYGQRLLQAAFWRKVFSSEFRLRDSLAGFWNSLTASIAARTEPTAVNRSSFIESMQNGFSAFKGRTLFLISEKDLTAKEFVDMASGSKAWTGLLRRPHVQIVKIAGADHTFSVDGTLDIALENMRTWLVSNFPDSRAGG
jgi:exosortase A-associated hydrolase 1